MVQMKFTQQEVKKLERNNENKEHSNINITGERRTDELGCINNGITHHELGRMDQICIHCGAKFWMEEKDRRSNRTSPTFSICCAHGKVLLPRLTESPSSYLLNLYTSSESDAITFHKNIRRYINILACTSFGANIENLPGQFPNSWSGLSSDRTLAAKGRSATRIRSVIHL